LNKAGERGTNSLAAYLRQPERFARASLSDWDRLIPQARKAGLLARVAIRIESSIGLDVVPPTVLPHLRSAQILAEKRVRDVRSDISRLSELLNARIGRLILLKGAAYVMADLPPGHGRIFSDIDILVPTEELAAVEAMLRLAGWRLGEINAYDELYYRRWMHQLPPLMNAARNSVIDVHHSIIPRTARVALEPADLLDRAIDLPGKFSLGVLAPADMVLHSAVHLFNEGEFARGLRDLDDINLLLRHFGSDDQFWNLLHSRALKLHLARPLFYALRYAKSIFDTPVPSELMFGLAERGPRTFVMDTVFDRALRSPHPSCRDWMSRPALWLLYVRAHYLRMPLYLLLPHLIRKAVRPSSEAEFAP
jgi:hypothetical protein